MASLKATIGSEHKELLRNKGKKRNQIVQNLKSIKVSSLWGAFPEAPWHDYCLSSAPLYPYVEITRLLIVSLTKPELPCGQGPFFTVLSIPSLAQCLALNTLC